MSFTGIPLAALDFYEDLENDNSKPFWTAHKHVYEAAVKAPLTELAVELEAEFGPYKMFRPYRDIRFAADKTPYKTQQGVWFGQTSRYLHVDAAGLFLAAGYWSTGSTQVDRLRRAVADDRAGAALLTAVQAAHRKGFQVGGQQLSRVPVGYDKQHPRADWLRYKTLTVGQQLGAPDWLPTAVALRQIRTRLRAAAPIVDWLDAHVGRG